MQPLYLQYKNLSYFRPWKRSKFHLLRQIRAYKLGVERGVHASEKIGEIEGDTLLLEDRRERTNKGRQIKIDKRDIKPEKNIPYYRKPLKMIKWSICTYSKPKMEVIRVYQTRKFSPR